MASMTESDHDLAGAFFTLGVDEMEKGQLQEAIKAFELGVNAAPELDGCWINWASVLFDLDRREEAVNVLRRGHLMAPHSTQITKNLVSVLELRQEHDEVAQALRRTFDANPNDPQIRYLIANRAHQEDRIKGLRAITVDTPHFTQAWRSLANALLFAGRIDELIRTIERAPTRDPWMLNALGLGLRDLGALPEALDCFDEAISLGRFNEIEGNALLTACYPSELSQADVSRRHLAWGDYHAIKKTIAPKVRPPSDRIKVGYLSSDLRTHSVAYFFEALLSHHDRSRVEITCLDLKPSPQDPIGKRLRSYGDRWVDVSGLDVAALITKLRDQQLDLIVELNGHTAGGRLVALSAQPAPMIITAIGYPQSTGLTAVDVRLTDMIADPPGSEKYYREKLERIEGGFLCYRPPDEAPEFTRMDADRPFTFGSFNQLSKISAETMRSWSAILLGAPKSRLVLKSRQLSNPTVAEIWRTRFAEYGIDASRLTLLGRIPDKQGHLKLYQEIDLALDTTPYNGTTTTVEALWMGTPVLALKGDRHSARVAASLLTHSGFVEWVVDTPEEYVSFALACASGDQTFPSRDDIREQLSNSPLMDPERYARQVETIYFDLWQSKYQDSEQAK